MNWSMVVCAKDKMLCNYNLFTIICTRMHRKMQPLHAFMHTDYLPARQMLAKEGGGTASPHNSKNTTQLCCDFDYGGRKGENKRTTTVLIDGGMRSWPSWCRRAADRQVQKRALNTPASFRIISGTLLSTIKPKPKHWRWCERLWEKHHVKERKK